MTLQDQVTIISHLRYQTYKPITHLIDFFLYVIQYYIKK